MHALNAVTIQAIHNNDKVFTVPYQPGITVLELVNGQYANPKKEGIPFLCTKGVCRSCTIKIIDNGGLLAEPSKAEQRALAVGRTAISLGYRLACVCSFQNEEKDTQK